MGEKRGASERNRTSDLLITNQFYINLQIIENNVNILFIRNIHCFCYRFCYVYLGLYRSLMDTIRTPDLSGTESFCALYSRFPIASTQPASPPHHLPQQYLGQRPSRGRGILFQIHFSKDFFVPWIAADIIKCWVNFDKTHVGKSFFIRFL